MNINHFSPRSENLYQKATQFLPAGVNSPVRAFKHVGMTPIFMKRGLGALIEDEDTHQYIDFCLAWGPLILGHTHPQVIDAVHQAVDNGLVFGTCHQYEAQLAELILAAFPYAEQARLVVSGTEAVLTATRLARAVSKRQLLVKFSGCYHGHVDALLVKAGSGLATQGLPDSAGIHDAVAKNTLVLPLGNIEILKDTFITYGDQIAAVILEPLPANNGLLIQQKEFLKEIRELTQKHGALLIFDEVISGLRFGFHGYAKMCDIEPDLTTLGKIIGGGLPVGAIIGKKSIMQRLAPIGDVYQAGTMSGNPVACAAGIATLKILKEGAVYSHLDHLGTLLDQAFTSRIKGKKPVQLARVGSIFWIYGDDSHHVPTRAEEISARAINFYRTQYQKWLQNGIYLSPSAYEVSFLSYAHQKQHIDKLIDVLAI